MNSIAQHEPAAEYPEPAEYVGKHRSAETQSWSTPIYRARHLKSRQPLIERFDERSWR